MLFDIANKMSPISYLVSFSIQYDCILLYTCV